MQFVQGAIDALHNTEGVADVGIYASPDVWNTIVGDYQPDVPFWMADWTGSGPAACAAYAGFAANNRLPSGPLEIVQYASDTFDHDYAC
jgi:GH25 family lysozyme M1 (1,4-beta-N-acetylmuramidase)